MAATSVRYTFRSLFPFPSTTHSIRSKSTSDMSSPATSDTQQPVQYIKSTSARFQAFLQALRIRSISAAEYGFFTTLRLFIWANVAHGLRLIMPPLKKACITPSHAVQSPVADFIPLTLNR